MGVRLNGPLGFEPAPEASVEEDVIASLVASYQASGSVEVQTLGRISDDLAFRISIEQVTEDQAEEVLFRLGLFHRSEGSYD
jgi:hypothetical protein